MNLPLDTFLMRVLCTVELKDIVKSGIKERFADLRRMGIASSHCAMTADTIPARCPNPKLIADDCS